MTQLSTRHKAPAIRRLSGPILTPQTGSPWASAMVLNPAIIRHGTSARIHMLFRASGPGQPYAGRDTPMPYPICLGYAWSDDEGKNWNADFDRPALYPRLAETFDALTMSMDGGRRILDHSNGCIEDPRLFAVEGDVYLTAACRIFPPGPYWEHDDPLQCVPAWALNDNTSGGRAVRENLTVTVLYRVDMESLNARRYEEAFTYLGPLSDPERSDNRDVFLFPEKLIIKGVPSYVMLHRPLTPEIYAAGYIKPTMFIAAARKLEDMSAHADDDYPLAAPLLTWESNRVGASAPPLRIDGARWLLPYHGKQDNMVGYTQSFMILEETPAGLPVLKHRCAERIFIAAAEWETQGKFAVPCVFTCGAIRSGPDLLMTYGAADTVCGAAWINFDELVRFVETFDANGKQYSPG